MPETIQTIAERIAALSADVDKRFADVDRRFDEVDKRFAEVTAAIVEQREYTEFAFTSLQRDVTQIRIDMKSGFGRLDRKLDRVLDTLTGTSSTRRRRS